MEKDQKQPQSGQPQGEPQPPQGGQPQSPPAGKGQEAAAGKGQGAPKQEAPKPLTRAEEYQKQLAEAQAKYITKYQTAWATYYQKTGGAHSEYNDKLRELSEGTRKAAKSQSSEEDEPAQNLQAFKEARTNTLRSTHDLHLQLRSAEQKYNQTLSSFWDDVWDSVAEAAQEFWAWIIGWWEEPPVEGAAPLRALADPAWRAAFDPAAAAYYSGWTYGPKLY